MELAEQARKFDDERRLLQETQETERRKLRDQCRHEVACITETARRDKEDALKLQLQQLTEQLRGIAGEVFQSLSFLQIQERARGARDEISFTDERYGAAIC